MTTGTYHFVNWNGAQVFSAISPDLNFSQRVPQEAGRYPRKETSEPEMSIA